MIGCIIKFRYYDFDRYDPNREPDIRTGIVVDAYTNITGSIKGNNEVFLGFGGGETSGSTKSKRMYKVLEQQGSYQKFHDIQEWQLQEIVKFSFSNTQEQNEEKFAHNNPM